MEEQQTLPSPKFLAASPTLPLLLQAKLDIRARRHHRSRKREIVAILTEALTQDDELQPAQELSNAILQGLSDTN